MENVVEIASRRSLDHVAEVMLDLETQVGSLFVHTFAESIKGCDNVLARRAEHERDRDLQTRFNADLAVFRRNHMIANARFRTACAAMFNNFVSSAAGAPPEPDDADEQPITSQHDLEFDLALFRIGKRCDDVAPRLRQQVQRRFQVLLGLADGTAAPLCGISLARLCRIGTSALELAPDARLTVLKCLEHDFSEICAKALDSANLIMIEHGVLPNLRGGAPRPVVPSALPTDSGAAVAVAIAVAPAEDPHAAPADLNDVVAQVSQWFTQHAHVAETTLALDPCAPQEPAEAGAGLSTLDAVRERRRMETTERRVAEISLARDLRQNAERSVDVLIRRATSQAYVPASIGAVLQGPLRRHLETILARRGESSPEWIKVSKLVREIAWCFDPDSARNEPAHWQNTVPSILRNVRDALESEALNERTVNQVIGAFRDRYQTLWSAVAATRSCSAATVASTMAQQPAVEMTQPG